MHCVFLAASLALESAGKSNAAKMAMMAMNRNHCRPCRHWVGLVDERRAMERLVKVADQVDEPRQKNRPLLRWSIRVRQSLFACPMP